jgi:hypothetical protein
LTTTSKAKGSISGPTGGGSRVSGSTTRCMGAGSSHGLMGGSTKVNT